MNEVTDDIAKLPTAWHMAGSISVAVLRAIERHAAELGPLTSSVETGCGKSTLLLSHLSQHHVVFTMGNPDNDDSHLKVLGSPLLNSNTVEWVYGPTQRTLPAYHFPEHIQLALIDGPHGYPFPQMEYWALYPHLCTGALLVVDDIQIPTIHQLFLFLKEDAMFSLTDRVLLQKLPVSNPDQLVLLATQSPTESKPVDSFSYPMYQDLRDGNTILSGMLCRFTIPASMSAEGQTERISAELVSGNYFQVLGVQALIGRTLMPDDARVPGAPPVVVLSNGFWSWRPG